MKATGERSNPLYGAKNGKGRFYIEAEKIWKDWEERMDEMPQEDRGRVLPLSYEEVEAAQKAKDRELAGAEQTQSAVERAAEVQWRLPPMPAHAPGQHPEYRTRKGQVKWSKRPVGWEPNPPGARGPIRKPEVSLCDARPENFGREQDQMPIAVPCPSPKRNSPSSGHSRCPGGN